MAPRNCVPAVSALAHAAAACSNCRQLFASLGGLALTIRRPRFTPLLQAASWNTSNSPARSQTQTCRQWYPIFRRNGCVVACEKAHHHCLLPDFLRLLPACCQHNTTGGTNTAARGSWLPMMMLLAAVTARFN